jgi:hypothetical protein
MHGMRRYTRRQSRLLFAGKPRFYARVSVVSGYFLDTTLPRHLKYQALQIHGFGNRQKDRVILRLGPPIQYA